ncbi:hypothetical protein D3C87_1771370 [compost metagenome]
MFAQTCRPLRQDDLRLVSIIDDRHQHRRIAQLEVTRRLNELRIEPMIAVIPPGRIERPAALMQRPATEFSG